MSRFFNTDYDWFGKQILSGMLALPITSRDGSTIISPWPPSQSPAGEPVGWAYAIYEGMSLKKAEGFGTAVRAEDHYGIHVPFTDSTPAAIMSCSKTIAEVAIIKAVELMQQQGLDVTLHDKIFPYLPAPWQTSAGPGVSKVTFRQVLAGTSGLMPSVSDRLQQGTYTNLQGSIQQGYQKSSPFEEGCIPGPPPYCYPQTSYSLCRILVPYMLSRIAPWVNDEWVQWALYSSPYAPGGKIAPFGQVPTYADASFFIDGDVHLNTGQSWIYFPFSAPSDFSYYIDLCTSALYATFVQNHLLAPAEIHLGAAGVYPPFTHPSTRYYNLDDWPDDSYVDAGMDELFPLLSCGSYGYHMSAPQLARFIAACANGRVIHPKNWHQMTSTDAFMTLANPVQGGGTGGGVFPAPATAGGILLSNGQPRTLGDKFSPSGPWRSLFFYKNGSWGGPGAGCRSAWMAFPNNVTAAIVNNSRAQAEPIPEYVLQVAYDASTTVFRQVGFEPNPGWFLD